MGRPPRHDADRLLDAAVSLVATHGPRGLTMAAVAREAGAPSGSVYHRFPDQRALLAAVWLRTVTRFQQRFLEALTGDNPRDAAVAAARQVVEWSRDNPAQAQILLAGPKEFGADRRNSEVDKAVRELAGRLDHTTSDRVLLAVVDLPYAVVRRYLSGGEPIPAHAADLVAEAAHALLASAAN
jgi:AcrR family transcriptional regulator